MSSERRGGGGLGAAFVLLIFIGFIVKFWVYIVAVLAGLVLCGLLWWAAASSARRADQRARVQAAIAARADEQHAQIMAGDDRGIYGAYPPAEPPPMPAAAERLPRVGENWHDYLGALRRDERTVWWM